MLSHFRVLIFACLCLMTYGSNAAPLAVWVALSANEDAYLAAAEGVRAEVERSHPGRIEWRIGPLAQFQREKGEPHAIVAVGAVALQEMQARFAADASPPPILAVLVAHRSFERLADAARLRAGLVSAAYLDQPPARQLALIRLALPNLRTVGVMLGGDSRSLVPEFERAGRESGIGLVTRMVAPGGLYSALQALLPEVDAMLALPDPEVHNSQTIANILTAAYRRRVPLFGFSPAYVRAGALAAVYSTPEQVGRRGGELLRQVMSHRSLPPPQWPREFSVGVNRDVARSLDLSVDAERIAESLRQRERP